MITITIGKRNDEVLVRGNVSWMEPGCNDDALLERCEEFAREIASVHGWIVDAKTSLYEYRERIARA